MEHQPTSDQLAVLRYRDLEERGLVNNRVTLGRWIRAGQFPPPIRLGANTVAWRVVDIERWLNDREAEAAELVAS